MPAESCQVDCNGMILEVSSDTRIPGMASAWVLFAFGIALLLLDVIKRSLHDAGSLLFHAIRSLKAPRYPEPYYSLVLLRVVASSRLGFSLRSKVLARGAIAVTVAGAAGDAESVHITTGMR
jgi:hypothetical protein